MPPPAMSLPTTPHLSCSDCALVTALPASALAPHRLVRTQQSRSERLALAQISARLLEVQIYHYSLKSLSVLFTFAVITNDLKLDGLKLH